MCFVSENQQFLSLSHRQIFTIVDVCSWRGLGKASEEKLVFFVAQATTRVLHGEDDIDLFFMLAVALAHVLLNERLTISPFSQSACNVAASEASEVRENGTLKL